MCQYALFIEVRGFAFMVPFVMGLLSLGRLLPWLAALKGSSALGAFTGPIVGLFWVVGAVEEVLDGKQNIWGARLCGGSKHAAIKLKVIPQRPKEH